MMVFALAACGDNNTTDPDKDSPGVSQSGENNNGGASLSTVKSMFDESDYTLTEK